MQNLRVTLVQPNQVWENKAANLEKYEQLLRDVESDLIVLPEMFQTCFTMNTKLGESSQNSESISWLEQMAEEKNAAFYTSLIIREDGRYFNRGVFVEPNGTVTFYDKRKTFGLAKENEHFQNGRSEVIVTYKEWKIQLQICYDLRFPEIVRNKISNQQAHYDVILYVANWPEKRSEHWKALLRARAIENQCFVVGVNRVGRDEMGFAYSGDSRLIDALGNEQKMNAHEEMTKTIVMNKNDLMKIRELLPFLKDGEQELPLRTRLNGMNHIYLLHFNFKQL